MAHSQRPGLRIDLPRPNRSMKTNFGTRRRHRRREASPPAKQAGSKRTLRTILVPVDFSEPSRAALKYAVRFAQDLGGSLGVLHVLDPLLTGGRFESPRLRQLKSSSRREATEQLQALRPELVQSGVRHKLFLRHGPATDSIVAFAVKVKADLIIMGSQGRTGLSRLLIGSVAERVVRHAPCPVLVVR